MPLIAIDGPSASGKGTIARAIACHFNLPHLDTGALYRAIGLLALRQNVSLYDTEALAQLSGSISPELLDDPDLRNAETATAASIVSALSEVRAALKSFQEEFAAQPGGAVLDGRDIGTVIAPHADAKLFITASPEVRAERRYLELSRNGFSTSFEEVLEDIRARDYRDQNRTEAPLVQAADAVLLDTSDLDIEAAVQRAVNIVLAHTEPELLNRVKAK